MTRAIWERAGVVTWVSYEDGVVLGAAAQDAHASADLLVAANDGVELRRFGGEVGAVLLQRLKLLVARVGVHAGAAAPHALQRCVQLAFAGACAACAVSVYCSSVRAGKEFRKFQCPAGVALQPVMSWQGRGACAG